MSDEVGAIVDRGVEIEFLAPGVESFVFTFGQPGAGEPLRYKGVGDTYVQWRRGAANFKFGLRLLEHQP